MGPKFLCYIGIEKDEVKNKTILQFYSWNIKFIKIIKIFFNINITDFNNSQTPNRLVSLGIDWQKSVQESIWR